MRKEINEKAMSIFQEADHSELLELSEVLEKEINLSELSIMEGFE